MDHRRTETFFAVVTPGLENVCAAELAKLGIALQGIESGGIHFEGRLNDLYLANLWSRTASRFLVRFAGFNSRDFPGLYRKALKLPWGRFIRPETSVAFRVTCHASRLNHTKRVAETLESSVNQAIGRSTNPIADSPQLVLVRIVDDQVIISIDSSGELLHRRGYRQAATVAPLRETLAAGTLMLLEWNGNEALEDPMCGTGSFLLEGAMLARHQAPGLNRSFAFMNWPGFREGLWKMLCNEALREVTDAVASIKGADENPEAVTAAKENCRRAASSSIVSFEQRKLAEQPVHEGRGLVVCNPPYGKRLALGEAPEIYYSELGRQLIRAYPGWRLAILCPDPALVKATRLPFKKIANLDNGGLSVGLFMKKS